MVWGLNEIFETVKMVELENLDVRTVTLGLNLLDCADGDIKVVAKNIKDKINKYAKNLVSTTKSFEQQYGISVANKRLSITPISLVVNSAKDKDFLLIGKTIDETARNLGIDFIGGFSALVQKGYTKTDKLLIESIPHVLANTQSLCSSVNVGSTLAGINMDAVFQLGKIIKDLAYNTKDQDSIGCAKLVIFTNMPEDNPFMAGATYGVGEAEASISVGVSGPGVVKRAIEKAGNVDLEELANIIKKTVFKITRAGELIGKMVAKELGLPFNIMDLSLAPTPLIGDSVAEIIEVIGINECGGPGTIAALAMLTDAVKKGGVMAATRIGGLSGAFIPVSEDAGMIKAVQNGNLSLEMLKAMTSVCSVGLDMVVIPGDTTPETISAIIADEMAIGMVNKKTTAVRIIPAYGKKEGDQVNFGGLLGMGPVMPVNQVKPNRFIHRGGRIPAPIISFKN